jgi:tRNA modification GTPase
VKLFFIFFLQLFLFFYKKSSLMGILPTICAISTPPGNGAIALIRLSGSKALQIIIPFISKNELKANQATFCYLKNNDDELIDDIIITYFQSPRSFTGEDMIEIACHGSLYIQQEIIKLCINSGALLAQPGEFTQRAYLNGKIDLSQAEAVADLIASNSKAAHKAAINQLKGKLSNELNNMRDKLLNLTILLELELDFSEEDVEFANRQQLLQLFDEIIAHTTKLAESFKTGNAIKQGIPVAIIGKPNAGKSTLLNAFLEEERAIVSEIPGTTRDTIEDTIHLNGFLFRFIDTAGIRQTADTIENMGIERSYATITKARTVLLLIDADDCLAEFNMLITQVRARMTDEQLLYVLVNKIDQYPEEMLKQKFGEIRFSAMLEHDQLFCISAKYEKFLEEVKTSLIDQIKNEQEGLNDLIITNTRHYNALLKTTQALERAKDNLINNISTDLVSQDTREAIFYLGEITGNISNDEVLRNIFERFCIGK